METYYMSSVIERKKGDYSASIERYRRKRGMGRISLEDI